MREHLYEVEIKSMAILREGHQSLITYAKATRKKLIPEQMKVLYPQYTKDEDKPKVLVTPITFREYEKRVNGGMITQKQHLINGKGNIFKVEDYETLGN